MASVLPVPLQRTSLNPKPNIPIHPSNKILSPTQSQSPPDSELDEPSEFSLHRAAQSGDYEKVQRLLPAPKRPLRQSSRSRTTGVTDSASIRLIDSHGFTALHYAVRGGYPRVVQCLLDFPGSRLTEVRDNAGKSALHWASQLGMLEVVEPLCKANASVIAEDRFGWTPLHYLCASPVARDTRYEKPVITIIDLLTKQMSPRGEPMHIWLLGDTQGRTPLHLAAWTGVTEAVFSKLLELDPNCNLARMTDGEGWSLLHWAVFGGQVEILSYILTTVRKNGGSQAVVHIINKQTSEGWSTLHLAAMAVRSECEVRKRTMEKPGQGGANMLPEDNKAIFLTEILVREGADTMLEDKKGRIPFYYAHLQAFNYPDLTDRKGMKAMKAIMSHLKKGGAENAYRKQFSPAKTAFDEIGHRNQSFLMRSKAQISPRADPAAVPRCHPLPYKACLARLEKIIQQKQLEPIFSKLNGSSSDLPFVLFPYANCFSTLPLAVKALPMSPRKAPIPKELILDLGALTLYDHAIIIDDSASMGFALGGSRRESVLSVLHNMTVVNQFLNGPRGRELEVVCFSSDSTQRLRPQLGFDKYVNAHNFSGASRVGTGILETVVKPLLQNWKMQRPMVVMILTDGNIDPVEADILEKAMLRATRKMYNMRASGAIVFQFVNFGTPVGRCKAGQQQVLQMLMNHPELRRVVDVLNWETDEWDVAHTQLMASSIHSEFSPAESKAAVEKMGRMLLAPIMASYKSRFTTEDMDED